MTRNKWQTIKSAIRNGYAWPGGYPLFLIMSDGEALSIDAARDNFKQICAAYLSDNRRSPWYAIAAEINWEDEQLYCAHTNAKIQSAYGDK